MSSYDLSVVIPMYNEADNAGRCLDRLTEYLSSLGSCELIFSDDGSTDGCGDIIAERIADNRADGVTVRLVGKEKNRGKGAAVREGILAAQGEYIMFTDCDLAYGTEVIGKMLGFIREGKFDYVIGSRAIHPDGYSGYSFFRKAASKIYMNALGIVGGFKHTDSQCGIKIFSSHAAAELFSRCETEGWAFDFEILCTASCLGMRGGEYPVRILENGKTKIRMFSSVIRMLCDVRRISARVKGNLRKY